MRDDEVPGIGTGRGQVPSEVSKERSWGPATLLSMPPSLMTICITMFFLTKNTQPGWRADCVRLSLVWVRFVWEQQRTPPHQKLIR